MDPRRRVFRTVAALGLACAAAVVMFSGQIAAQPSPSGSQQSHKHKRGDIQWIAALRPEAGSDLVLPIMQLGVYPDGDAVVWQEHRTRARQLETSYGWVVDFDGLTYRTFKMDRPGANERMRDHVNRLRELRRPVSGIWRGPASVRWRPVFRNAGYSPSTLPSPRGTFTPPIAQRTTTAAAQEGGPCNCCPTCECGGYWWARAEVRDIFGWGVLLATTNVQIGWNSSFSRPEWNECDMESWTTTWGCWAAAPSSLGTNWYAAGCYLDEEHYPWNDRFGFAEANGIYYNYDFVPSGGDVVWADEKVYVYVSGSQTGSGQFHDFGGDWTRAGLGAGWFRDGGMNTCSM